MIHLVEARLMLPGPAWILVIPELSPCQCHISHAKIMQASDGTARRASWRMLKLSPCQCHISHGKDHAGFRWDRKTSFLAYAASKCRRLACALASEAHARLNAAYASSKCRRLACALALEAHAGLNGLVAQGKKIDILEGLLVPLQILHALPVGCQGREGFRRQHLQRHI